MNTTEIQTMEVMSAIRGIHDTAGAYWRGENIGSSWYNHWRHAFTVLQFHGCADELRPDIKMIPPHLPEFLREQLQSRKKITWLNCVGKAISKEWYWNRELQTALAILWRLLYEAQRYWTTDRLEGPASMHNAPEWEKTFSQAKLLLQQYSDEQ